MTLDAPAAAFAEAAAADGIELALDGKGAAAYAHVRDPLLNR